MYFFVFKNNIIIGISCRVFVFFFKFFLFCPTFLVSSVLNHISILRILLSDYLFCQLVCLRSCALGSHRMCVCLRVSVNMYMLVE